MGRILHVSFSFFFAGKDQILSQYKMFLWCCNALSVYTFRRIDTVRYNYRLRENLNKTQSCNIRRAQPEGNFNGVLPMSMILLNRPQNWTSLRKKLDGNLAVFSSFTHQQYILSKHTRLTSLVLIQHCAFLHRALSAKDQLSYLLI